MVIPKPSSTRVAVLCEQCGRTMTFVPRNENWSPRTGSTRHTCRSCEAQAKGDDEMGVNMGIPMSLLEFERYMDRRDKRAWNLPIDEGT